MADEQLPARPVDATPSSQLIGDGTAAVPQTVVQCSGDEASRTHVTSRTKQTVLPLALRQPIQNQRQYVIPSSGR
jgi:hypothetical protein